MKRFYIVLAAALIISLFYFNIHIIYPMGSQMYIVSIVIDEDGVAKVSLNASIYKGLNRVYLPVTPVPETIDVRLDGRSIAAIYFNESIVVPSDSNGTAYISYIANVTVVGGKIILDIGKARVSLKVMNNIVLLTLPKNVTEAYTEDGNLILTFTGPAKITYTVGEAEAAGGGGGGPPIVTWYPWWIVIIIVAIAIAIGIIFTKRRTYEGIDETDRMILKFLERRGGRALQSEIMDELKIPKTTLWRHVKRLEKGGYVEVVKVGRVNIVKLKK